MKIKNGYDPDDCLYYVLGNKADADTKHMAFLIDEEEDMSFSRQVSREEGLKWTNDYRSEDGKKINIQFLEVSAVDELNT